MLKWVARIFAVLTLVVCVSLFYFPDMKVWVAEERMRREEEAARKAEEEAAEEAAMTAQIEALMERSAMETAEQENSTETGEEQDKITGTIQIEDEDLGAQLKIELPEGVSESDVKITNRYVEQIVQITFPSEVDDYFANYHVQGSSDGIDSMMYYRKGKKGVLELKTNQVYEPVEKFGEGNIYLDLLDPHEVYDKVVVIDAGHGGSKPGAVKDGVQEKDIDLAIVRETKALLDKTSADKKIGVYYTRLKDENPTLEQRVGLANAANADLFISVHNNSTASSQAAAILQGTQVLFDEADDSKLSSRLFAEICLEEMTEALSSKTIGLLEGDDIYIIRNSEMPVALIEVGFMTNPQELARLSSEEYQKKAAQGIYNALQRAFAEGF